MSQIQLKFAEQKDCERILALIVELAVYEKAPNAVTMSLAHFIESGFGPKPVWKAYVCTVDDKIEGFALFYTRFSTWKGQMLYLEDFYVSPNNRKLGLGKLLFDAVVAYAKNEGFCGLTWQVLEWNQLALDFYAKYDAIIEKDWYNVKIFFK
jgi:GNAT superfamily N-acetyltransferase